MHEEEILVKIGEKTREASNSKLIDKTKRDSNIGLAQKRQSQSSGLGLSAGSGTPASPAPSQTLRRGCGRLRGPRQRP